MVQADSYLHVHILHMSCLIFHDVGLCSAHADLQENCLVIMMTAWTSIAYPTCSLWKATLTARPTTRSSRLPLLPMVKLCREGKVAALESMMFQVDNFSWPNLTEFIILSQMSKFCRLWLWDPISYLYHNYWCNHTRVITLQIQPWSLLPLLWSKSGWRNCQWVW